MKNNFPWQLWHKLRLVNKELVPESDINVFLFYKKSVYKEASRLDGWGDGVKLNGVRGKLLKLYKIAGFLLGHSHKMM